MDKIIYLDHAAATPLDERVFAVMQPFFAEQFYNPTAAYQPARDVRAIYEDARHRLGMAIGASRDEIIITAGATESVNIAIHGVLSGVGHAVIGATEHAAVRGAVAPFSHSVAKTDKKGTITPEAVRELITDETRLVSVALAESELGTVQKLRDIATVIETVRQERLGKGIGTPIYLHSDASQGAGLLDVNVARLGVDLLTLNAGKIYGPKQVGLLFVRRGIVLEPLVRGGGQERGIRSGTENVAGTVGFAMALEMAQKKRHSESKRLELLRDTLQDRLVRAIPDLVVNGSKRHLPSHLHISVPGLDAERAVFALESRGVLVATGAACAANKGTRSHTLVAIGMDEDLADGSLRFTLGRLNDEQNVAIAAQEIIDVIQTERNR
jgi:cysteine desulfurase